MHLINKASKLFIGNTSIVIAIKRRHKFVYKCYARSPIQIGEILVYNLNLSVGKKLSSTQLIHKLLRACAKYHILFLPNVAVLKTALLTKLLYHCKSYALLIA